MAEKKDTKKKTKKKPVNSNKTTKRKTTNRKTVRKKKEDKSLNLLKIVFCLLIVLVIVLSVVVVKKKQEFNDKVNANIAIPIINKETEAAFSINLKSLSEKGQYIFRISNSRANDINTEDLNYTIYVQNNTDSKISLTKYGSDKDLITNQQETIINGGKVAKNEKVSEYYVVKITDAGSLGKKDMVNVKVAVTK